MPSEVRGCLSNAFWQIEKVKFILHKHRQTQQTQYKTELRQLIYEIKNTQHKPLQQPSNTESLEK